MKIIAKHRCQLEGHIWDVGEVGEYSGEITSRIAHNFTDKEGKALVAKDSSTTGQGTKTNASGEKASETKKPSDEDKVAKLLKSMNREQLLAKLDERGITYKPSHKTDYLAKLYLQAIGELG